MPTSRRLILSPLLLAAVALAGFLGVAASSTAAGPGPETRVRANVTVTVDAVGQRSGEAAGGVGCLRPSQPDFVSGSCVATEAGGDLRVLGSGLSASERGAAEALAGQGRSVVLREASGVGPTSDLLIDGIPYDVYTPTTGNLDRIVSAIASKGSQVNGGGIVLDLSKSPLTGVDQAALLARVQGVTSNISDIIIVGG